MYTFLVVVQVLVAVSLIALVLVQHGKGADAGAAFGSGASGTVFGARGSANFLSRATGYLAAVFFCVSLALAYLINGRGNTGSVTDSLPAAVAPAPAAKVTPVLPPAATAASPAAAPAAAPSEPKPVLPQ